MVSLCPGWSSEKICSGMLSYTGFSSFWHLPIGSRKQSLLKIFILVITYKMFEEIV
jgi:hypothetical protein